MQPFRDLKAEISGITHSTQTKTTTSKFSIHSHTSTTSQLELLNILHSNLDTLIHTLNLGALAQTRRPLSASLATNHTSDLARPLDSISALSTSFLADVTAVDDFAVSSGVGGEEVNGLVLVCALLWIGDCLNGFGNGFGVGGHVLDVDDRGRGGSVLGEVFAD